MNNGSAAYTKLSQDEEALELDLREQPSNEARGIYFRDDAESKKRIDFVIVYETNTDDISNDSEQSTKLENLRNAFENNLRKAGILIEYDEVSLPEVCVDPAA